MVAFIGRNFSAYFEGELSGARCTITTKVKEFFPISRNAASLDSSLLSFSVRTIIFSAVVPVENQFIVSY